MVEGMNDGINNWVNGGKNEQMQWIRERMT